MKVSRLSLFVCGFMVVSSIASAVDKPTEQKRNAALQKIYQATREQSLEARLNTRNSLEFGYAARSGSQATNESAAALAPAEAPQMLAPTDAGTGASTQTEIPTDNGAEMPMEAGTQTETETETEIGTQTETETETGTVMQTATEADTQTGTQTDTATSTEMSTQTSTTTDDGVAGEPGDEGEQGEAGEGDEPPPFNPYTDHGNGTYTHHVYENPDLEDKGNLLAILNYSAPSAESEDRKMIRKEEFTYVGDTDEATFITVTDYADDGINIWRVTTLSRPTIVAEFRPLTQTTYEYFGVVDNGDGTTTDLSDVKKSETIVTFATEVIGVGTTERTFSRNGNLLTEHVDNGDGGEYMLINAEFGDVVKPDLEWTKLNGEWASYTDHVYAWDGTLIATFDTPPNF